MGQRGPKVKPTELKMIQGTYRADRAPENEPKPSVPAAVPEPPAHLDTVAKKEWRRLAPELFRLGLLTKVDLGTFEVYCLSYGRLVAAHKSLKKAKTMFHEYTNKAGATNFVARPEIAVIQKESLVIKAFCAEFGLSPSARTRMEAPTILPGGAGPPADEKNSFDGFLNGPRKQILPGT